MSSIISGKLRLEMQPLSAATFIDAAVETIQPTAEAKGIRLTKRLDSDGISSAAMPAGCSRLFGTCSATPSNSLRKAEASMSCYDATAPTAKSA